MNPIADSQRLPSWVRRSLLLGTLALAFVGSLALLRVALAVEEIGPFPTRLNGVERTELLGQNLQAARAKGNTRNILMLGDSMLMPLKKPRFTPSHTVPGRLREILEESTSDATLNVVSIRNPGAGYTTYYFLADRIIEAGPDQIALEFNPGNMSAQWRSRWASVDYAAFLGWRRIPEALTLPLYKLGLTADRLLWTVACQELGGVGLWRRVAETQGRVTRLRDALHRRVAEAVGSEAEAKFKAITLELEMSRKYTPGMIRRRKPAYESSYREALAGVKPDDVAIRMLGATVRRFVNAGIPTLVYVAPINVEHMREVGALTGDGVVQSLAHLGVAVRAAGGTYADFHDLLSDAHFIDAAGHLTFEGEHNGGALFARELAPLLLGQANAASRQSRPAD
jgi:hypothetical protein